MVLVLYMLVVAAAASDMSGDKVCPQNETFAYCALRCPTNYCPIDDNRGIIACDPPYPCPSGCSCQRNYRRKSEDDDRCIRASECPPVECTRPNEEWDSCTNLCFSDYCSDRKKVPNPEDCPFSNTDCYPKCVCKQGFYRDRTDICVKAQECPSDN